MELRGSKAEVESLQAIAARCVRKSWSQLVDNNVSVSDKERERLIRVLYNDWKRRNGISIERENRLLKDVVQIIKDRREEIDYTRYTHTKTYEKLCESLGFHYEHINKKSLPSYSDENDNKSYYYNDKGHRLSTCSAQAIFFCKPKAWNWEFSRFEKESICISEEELWLNSGVI